MSKHFEQIFAGKDNAGLRAKIRETAKAALVQGRDVEQAILMLGDTVALSAWGKRDLATCAGEYKRANA